MDIKKVGYGIPQKPLNKFKKRSQSDRSDQQQSDHRSKQQDSEEFVRPGHFEQSEDHTKNSSPFIDDHGEDLTIERLSEMATQINRHPFYQKRKLKILVQSKMALDSVEVREIESEKIVQTIGPWQLYQLWKKSTSENGPPMKGGLLNIVT